MSSTNEERPVRILLADNHTMFRQSVASMLTRDGEVEVVGDADHGPQAVELAKETKPDLVIMQVERPPEKAAPEIQGILEASPDSRVIILSMHQDSQMVREVLGLGTSAYVHKSATIEELLQMIRHAAHGSPEQDSNRAVLAMPERMIEQIQKANDYNLTAREYEVFILAGRGLRNRQIASQLYLAESTVSRHLANIYAKMGVASRTEAVRKALGERWITQEDITEEETA